MKPAVIRALSTAIHLAIEADRKRYAQVIKDKKITVD